MVPGPLNGLLRRIWGWMKGDEMAQQTSELFRGREGVEMKFTAAVNGVYISSAMVLNAEAEYTDTNGEGKSVTVTFDDVEGGLWVYAVAIGYYAGSIN